MTLYPNGYGTSLITLDEMARLHGGKMHPEFHRRFFDYVESKNGLLGVGGGWREVQPVRPGFAPPGKSFHETQRFGSGFSGYAAVDLVVPRGHGLVHRAPSWGETGDAPGFGLHTFINNEPWHIQCLEMRGFDSWVAAGRPDPQPPAVVMPVVSPIVQEDGTMILGYIAIPPAGMSGNPPWLLRLDGTWSYLTSKDWTDVRALGFPEVTLQPDQYGHARKCANV